jgi:hypothetical protein
MAPLGELPGEGADPDVSMGSFSQLNRSFLGRLSSPFGPFTQLVLLSVNTMTLSLWRQTSRPPVVRCSTFPLSGFGCWSSRQSPTVSEPTSSRIVVKSALNSQDGWAPAGVSCHESKAMVVSMASAFLDSTIVGPLRTLTVYLASPSSQWDFE